MIQSPETLPRHIKSITEQPIHDTNGTQHSHVTVEFRWWYRPIAWWHMLRSRPITIDLESHHVLARTADVLSALPRGADVGAIVRAMEPNENTIIAGLVALFLARGESIEEIIARFLRAHERAIHASDR